MTPEDQAVQVDPSSVVRLTTEPVVLDDVTVAVLTSEGEVVKTVELGLELRPRLHPRWSPQRRLSSHRQRREGRRRKPGRWKPYTSAFFTLDTLGPTIAELRLGVPTPEANAPVIVEAVLETPENGVRSPSRRTLWRWGPASSTPWRWPIHCPPAVR